MRRQVIEYNEEHEDTLQKFKHLCVFEGKDMSEEILGMINSYVTLMYPFQITLVDENTLLKKAKNLGLKPNRPLLHKYRTQNFIDGLFWTNDKNRTVYDLDKMIEFLTERSKNPKSRINANQVSPSVSSVS